MSKQSVFAAIDVGTNKVCSIIANKGDNDGLRILGVGVVPSRGVRKGIVIDVDETREAIRESVRKAEMTSGVKVESAYIGISGRHVSSANTSSAVAISRGDRVVHTRDLKRVFGDVRNVKVSPDRQLLHVIPRGYSLDGHEGVKNPVGMHGFRLDADTHVITASQTSVQNLAKAVKGAGVEIEDLVLSPLAAAEAVLSPDVRAAGVALIDIGGGTAEVSIFKDGSVWFTSVVPFGGYQITRDIAIGLGVSSELAEQIKIKHGSVMPTTNGKAKGDVEATHISANGHDILAQDLTDIIQSRLDEIMRLAYNECPQPEYLVSMLPAGVVLCGGTSNLPGIDRMAREIFGLSVNIGIPQDVFGLADQLHDPAYATSVGLILWGARQNTGEWQASNKRLKHRLGFPVRFMRRQVQRRFHAI